MKTGKTSDIVFDHIKERIVNKTWKQGDKITSELQLVEELGVSRMSVREAIGKLVTLNILVKRRGGGTFVSEIEAQDYLDNLLPILMTGRVDYKQILEFRGAIDVLGVKLFIEKATTEDYKELRDCFEKMVANKNDNEKFFKDDMMFHKIISLGSKNPLLYKVIDMVFEIMKTDANDEYHSLTSEKRIEEHRKILEAIEEKDIELATIFMKRHLERTIREL